MKMKRKNSAKRRRMFFGGAVAGSFVIALVLAFVVDISAIPGLVLVPNYLFGVVSLKFINNICMKQKDRLARFFVFLAAIGAWYFFWFSAMIGIALFSLIPGLVFGMGVTESLFKNVNYWILFLPSEEIEPLLTFAVFIIPGHYWAVFSKEPDQKNAWKALAALVTGAVMFWWVLKYGVDYCIRFYYWVNMDKIIMEWNDV